MLNTEGPTISVRIVGDPVRAAALRDVTDSRAITAVHPRWCLALERARLLSAASAVIFDDRDRNSALSRPRQQHRKATSPRLLATVAVTRIARRKNTRATERAGGCRSVLQSQSERLGVCLRGYVADVRDAASRDN